MYDINLTSMHVNIKNIKHLNSTGIYKILNTVNNKYYIGSTEEYFIIRWYNHINALRRGTHKNTHLQNAWNKYKENSFSFEILEICDKANCLFREQLYLDKHNSKNTYNMNPLATGPSKTEESKQKRSESLKKFNLYCSRFYKELKLKKIKLEDIPKKYHEKIQYYDKIQPWNKGIKYNSTDHLKVKHRIGDRSLCKNAMRDKQPIIYVYDLDFNFVDSFRSSKDLEELSLKMILPLTLKRYSKKKEKPNHFICSSNVMRCLKENKSYKGLYFKTQPLHPGMDDRNEPKSVKVWNDNAEVSE